MSLAVRTARPYPGRCGRHQR